MSSFSQPSSIYEVAIKRFNGLRWDTLGNSFAPSTSGIPPHLTIDNSYNPYVFYRDNSNARRGTVRRFTNGNWNLLGNVGFTFDAVISTNLYFNRADIPYALFVDSSQKITVMSYNGTIWDTVGKRKFATTTNARLEFGHADTPYVVFVDSSRITVMKYDGVDWDTVGNRRFTVANSATMKFDTLGTPYIAYLDPAALNRATVMKFNGTSWTAIPSFGGLSNLSATNLGLLVDSTNNMVYVHFQDAGGGATVKKYDGTAWTNVGTAGFAQGTLYNLHVSKNGTPWSLITNSDSAYFMKFNGSIWTQATKSLKKISTVSAFTMKHDSIPVIAHNVPSLANKPVIANYTNSVWSRVGEYGFAPSGVRKSTNSPYSNPIPTLLQTATKSDNTPLVVYSDNADSGKLSMMKFTSGTWSYEGSPTFTTANAIPYKLLVGKNDTIYLLYYETGPYGLKLAYFNGTTFINIPSGLTNNVYPIGTAFILDTAKIPTVAYPDPTNFNLVNIKKLINGNWTVVGSLPCTTAVQIEVNSQNEVHALYNSGTGTATVSNLVKQTGSTWISLVQSPLQGLMKIAPNDSVFLFSRILNSWWTPAGLTGYMSYQSNRTLYRYAAGNWVSFHTFHITPIHNSSPPTINETYVNFLFDTSSTPYMAVAFGDSVSIKTIMTNLSVPNGGWHPLIKTPNFDFAFAPNNKLIAAYSEGTAYALSFKPDTIPVAPQVVSPVSYCIGDIANPLVAFGQNLRWSGPGVQNSSITPTPSTAVAGTFNFSVKQENGVYSGPSSIITVTVHPKSTVTTSTTKICDGDTAWLTTPSVNGATYRWSKIDTVGGGMSVTSFFASNTIPVTDSNLYTVLVTPNGCISDTTRVRVVALTQPTITISAPTAMIVGQVTVLKALVANASAPYSIDWQINSSWIGINWGDSLVFTKQAGQETVKAIVYQTGNVCFKRDTATIVIDEMPNSVALLNRNPINVFPNPSEGIVSFKSATPISEVELTSIDGKPVHQSQHNSLQVTINLKETPNGIYLYTVTSGAVKWRGKLILQRGK
ncbi:MAG TPA: T9SS type A sorting domain-containing protein [Flavipsychrobacter sp.]|nr:T9SS type A sorting domain-containing protein [Flavipsychrobacter sp.]